MSHRPLFSFECNASWNISAVILKFFEYKINTFDFSPKERFSSSCPSSLCRHYKCRGKPFQFMLSSWCYEVLVRLLLI